MKFSGDVYAGAEQKRERKKGPEFSSIRDSIGKPKSIERNEKTKNIEERSEKGDARAFHEMAYHYSVKNDYKKVAVWLKKDQKRPHLSIHAGYTVHEGIGGTKGFTGRNKNMEAASNTVASSICAHLILCPLP